MIFKNVTNVTGVIPMRSNYIVLCILIMPLVAHSQETVWLKVEAGDVLYLSPLESKWIPSAEKEEIPAKTYVMTTEGSRATIFQETSVYELPPHGYFFVDDIFSRNRIELVGALTRIEAELLPVKDHRSNEDQPKPVGLIYGEQPKDPAGNGNIPFEIERGNAIQRFITHGRYDAALLCLKRMVARYPQAYLNQSYVDQLFKLYEWFDLAGFLLEESTLLLEIKKSESYQQIVEHWNDLARKRIRSREED